LTAADVQRTANDQVGAAEIERPTIEVTDSVGRKDGIGRRVRRMQQQQDCRGAQTKTRENPSELPRRFDSPLPSHFRGPFRIAVEIVALFEENLSCLLVRCQLKRTEKEELEPTSRNSLLRHHRLRRSSTIAKPTKALPIADIV